MDGSTEFDFDVDEPETEDKIEPKITKLSD
jgi:hypothetical protein